MSLYICTKITSGAKIYWCFVKMRIEFRNWGSYLDKVFAHRLSVEHRIERDDFVDSHGLLLNGLGHLVDGCQREPAAALIEKIDNSTQLNLKLKSPSGVKTIKFKVRNKCNAIAQRANTRDRPVSALSLVEE